MIQENSLEIFLPHHRKESNKYVNIRNYLRDERLFYSLFPFIFFPTVFQSGDQLVLHSDLEF